MQTASRQAGGHNESTNKSQHTQESVYHIEAQLIPDNIRNHSPSSHNVADTNINVKKSLFPGNDKPSHQLNPLEELKFALSSISEDDSSKILPLIMKLIEYYHIHIKRLKDLNPRLVIEGVPENLTEANAARLVEQADVAVCAGPLFEERLAMNAACVPAIFRHSFTRSSVSDGSAPVSEKSSVETDV